MKGGNQFASPVFKKRFARRKTTQRPFTFASNAEAEEPLAGAKSPVVSQVEDRGVVIASPVQLARSNEKLTISENVRQSPVPAAIAHSTPRKEETEQASDDNNDDEANTSLVRRSGRSRVPSKQFLSRRQHPHGTPQLPKAQSKADESYIGSQNSSNIHAEVSTVDKDGQSRVGRRNISASSSRPSKQTPKAKTVEKPTEPASSARGKTQTEGGDQSEGNRSGGKDALARKGSSRRVTSASAQTSSSSRRGRGRTGQDRTPPPQPSPQKQKRNLSHSVAPSPLSKRKKEENGVDSSSSKKVAMKNKTPPSSSLKGKKAGSVPTSNRTSKSLKKRTPQSDVGKEKCVGAAVRSVEKSLPEERNRSYSSDYEDPIPLHADNDLSVSGPRETQSKSPPQGNKQALLPQTEKENRPLPKNREATSPTPSSQRKRNKTMDSSSKGESTSMLRSSRKDRSNSELQASSSSSKHAPQSQEENPVTSSSAKKRKKGVADESVHSNVSVRLSPIREDETRNRSTRNSGKGNRSDLQVKGKSGKDPEPMISSASRKKKITPVENDVGILGPSPKKRARSSYVHDDTEADSARDESQRQKSLPSSSLSRIQSGREKSPVLSMSDMQSTKKNKRESSQSKNQSENGSLANSRVSQGGQTNYASTSRIKDFDPQASVPSSSHERVRSSVQKSPRKTVASKGVDDRSSPRMSPRKGKSSNSFWKPTRPMGSSVKSRRQQPALSQSSLYDDHSLGGGEVGVSVVVSHQAPGKRSASASRDSKKSNCKPSQSTEEEAKRPRPVVTELGVIISMLEEAEDDIMEEPGMSELCQKAVHKAFTFTKQQLQQTESQLKEISEVEYQINKLKSTCKAMSSESKEKLQQKFILQKELQSLKARGIDADMVRIDQWLQDFQALRLCNN